MKSRFNLCLKNVKKRKRWEKECWKEREKVSWVERVKFSDLFLFSITPYVLIKWSNGSKEQICMELSHEFAWIVQWFRAWLSLLRLNLMDFIVHTTMKFIVSSISGSFCSVTCQRTIFYPTTSPLWSNRPKH